MGGPGGNTCVYLLTHPLSFCAFFSCLFPLVTVRRTCLPFLFPFSSLPLLFSCVAPQPNKHAHCLCPFCVRPWPFCFVCVCVVHAPRRAMVCELVVSNQHVRLSMNFIV